MQLKHIIIIPVLVYLVFGLIGCHDKQRAKGNEVMVASISSNGRYVITTNKNRHAYLWDLKQHKQKQISTFPVNIYSAYFIKHSNHFMIQNDDTNQVMIQSVNGNAIKHFNPGFASYGEVITHNLKDYFAAKESLTVKQIKLPSNQTITLHKSWCQQDHNHKQYSGSATYSCTHFFARGKLMNLTLTPDEQYLIGGDTGSILLWSTSTPKIRKNISGAETKNGIAISPDGHYVVTGDVGKVGIIYDLNKHQLVYDQNYAIETPKKDTINPYFKGPYNQNSIGEITGLNFISHENYLVSFRGHDAPFHYLAMYKANDITWRHEKDGTFPSTYPIKYLKLDTKTVTVHKNGKTHKKTIYPETQSFLRSQSFDIAPQANRVVMGQANGGGIMVYQYDPDKQKLKLIWAPQLKEHDGHWWAFW